MNQEAPASNTVGVKRWVCSHDRIFYEDEINADEYQEIRNNIATLKLWQLTIKKRSDIILIDSQRSRALIIVKARQI